MIQRLGFIYLIFASFVGNVCAQSVTFSELNYNSDSTTNSSNWVELYNYGSSSVDLSGWFLKDNNNANLFTFPSGITLAAGARLVVVNSVAEFTGQFPLVSNYLGEMDFSFGNDADEVRLFDNSGLLKLYMSYTDTFPWPEGADGTGRTIELTDPLVSPDTPSNWFVGCMKGSPGKGFTPCDDPLIFSEINYNSDTLLDSGDWIELYNRSTGGINLTGWSFKDSNDDNPYFFPLNTQIASGARLVIVHDTAKFKIRHPDVTNYVGPFDFNLSNDGELVRLFNFQGKLTFSVVYDDDGDWPAGADGGDYTLELLSATGNMNSYSNWFTGCPEGSPGIEYDPNCNVGIESAVNNPLVAMVAQQGDIILIQFGQNIQNQKFSVSLYNLFGQEFLKRDTAGYETSINTRNLPQGIYVLSVKSGNSFWSKKLFIH